MIEINRKPFKDGPIDIRLWEARRKNDRRREALRAWLSKRAEAARRLRTVIKRTEK